MRAGDRPTILLADGKPWSHSALARELAQNGYQVHLAADDREALTRLLSPGIDVIVLDSALPEGGGIALCGALRQHGITAPVLLLTAAESVEERVAGLDAGAYDCLPRPVALTEFTARVRALLRRFGQNEVEPKPLAVGDLVLDVAAMEGSRGGRRFHLSRTEFLLLEVLMRHPGKALEREVLFGAVWGADVSLAQRSLDVYVGYLRRKLEAGGEPRLLHTVIFLR